MKNTRPFFRSGAVPDHHFHLLPWHTRRHRRLWRHCRRKFRQCQALAPRNRDGPRTRILKADMRNLYFLFISTILKWECSMECFLHLQEGLGHCKVFLGTIQKSIFGFLSLIDTFIFKGWPVLRGYSVPLPSSLYLLLSSISIRRPVLLCRSELWRGEQDPGGEQEWRPWQKSESAFSLYLQFFSRRFPYLIRNWIRTRILIRSVYVDGSVVRFLNPVVQIRV